MKTLKEDLNKLKDKHNLTLQDIAEKLFQWLGFRVDVLAIADFVLELSGF